jgi:hypothetical protein
MEIETLHLLVLACTGVVILHADHEGYKYVSGKKEVLSASWVTWSHRLVWGGLVSMILTGIALALPRSQYLLQDPIFFVKMAFVLILIINAYAIGKLSLVATTKPYRELEKDTQRTLLISGGISMVGWVGASVIGFFFL